MPTTYKELGSAVLSGAAASVYTVPALTQAAIHTAQLWNPSASPVVVDVFLLPPGGSATDATHVERIQVPAAAAAPVYGIINQKMGPGYAVYALGAGVTMTLTGVENT